MMEPTDEQKKLRTENRGEKKTTVRCSSTKDPAHTRIHKLTNKKNKKEQRRKKEGGQLNTKWGLLNYRKAKVSTLEPKKKGQGKEDSELCSRIGRQTRTFI